MKAFFLTPLVIFLVMLLIFMAKLLDTGAKTESALIGKQLPAFELPVLEGVGSFKSDELKGRYTLVNVFASWCIPCKLEYPFLVQIKKEGKIPVYGIDWKDKDGDVQKWFKELGNPYTKIGNDLDGQVIIKLGVTGAPETFLISPDGVVLYNYSGILTKDVYEKEILGRMK